MARNILLPEGRWKIANERCPNPDRWHSTDEDSTEIEVSELVAALVRALQPNVVVETGSAWGQTTELIVQALQRNGQGYLVTLELDPVRAQATRERVCVPEGEWWKLLLEDSTQWNASQLPFPIDLVFSDSYGPVRIPEVVRLLPYMRDQATVVFHDTAPEPDFPFRKMIEDELVSTGIMKVVDLPTPRGVSICQVVSRV